MPILKEEAALKSAYEKLRKRVDQRFSGSLGDFEQKQRDFKGVIERTAGLFKRDFPKNKSSVAIVREMRKQWRST